MGYHWAMHDEGELDAFLDGDGPSLRWQDYIERRPDVSFGKPVFRSTRIGVNLAFAERSAGMSFDEYLEQHPTVTREHLRSALLYAANLAVAERVGPWSGRVREVVKYRGEPQSERAELDAAIDR